MDRGEYNQNHSKDSGYDGYGSGLWNCVQSSWAPAAAQTFVYGNFLWTGFDCKCCMRSILKTWRRIMFPLKSHQL